MDVNDPLCAYNSVFMRWLLESKKNLIQKYAEKILKSLIGVLCKTPPKAPVAITIGNGDSIIHQAQY